MFIKEWVQTINIDTDKTTNNFANAKLKRMNF